MPNTVRHLRRQRSLTPEIGIERHGSKNAGESAEKDDPGWSNRFPEGALEAGIIPLIDEILHHTLIKSPRDQAKPPVIA